MGARVDKEVMKHAYTLANRSVRILVDCSLVDTAPSKVSQSHGWTRFRIDAGKNITGRKRHILVDTQGLLLNVAVHPASVQNRDGAADLLRRTRRQFPFIERIFADGGYRGPKMAAVVARTGTWWRSSNAPSCIAASSHPSDGSSNAHLPGYPATAASLATSNATPGPSPLSSASPWPASCSDA